MFCSPLTPDDSGTNTDTDMPRDSEPPSDDKDHSRQLIEVVLAKESIVPDTPEVEHYRESAIYDLLQDNIIILPNRAAGPYTLLIERERVRGQERLLLHVGDENKKPLLSVILSMTSLRPIMRDYTSLCDSYYEAIKMASVNNIEAIDAGRRGLHNEGANQLQERLNGKIDLDHETARRFFALICAIYRRGRC